MRFGVKINQNGLAWPELLARIRYAESLGFAGAFIFDHFRSGDPPEDCMEAWSLLAALAASTEQIRLGALVTGVTFRPPGVLAAQAVTVDRISGGRLELCIGAAWNEEEHRTLGLAFPCDRERAERLEEAVHVIRLVMTKDDARFEGRHYALDGASYRPRPVQQPHPPVWIGAGGDRRTIPIAARRADVWHCFSPLEELPAKVEVFERHAREAGRDPGTILRAANVELNEPIEVVGRKVDELEALGFGYVIAHWFDADHAPLDEFARIVMGRS